MKRMWKWIFPLIVVAYLAAAIMTNPLSRMILTHAWWIVLANVVVCLWWRHRKGLPLISWQLPSKPKFLGFAAVHMVYVGAMFLIFTIPIGVDCSEQAHVTRVLSVCEVGSQHGKFVASKPQWDSFLRTLEGAPNELTPSPRSAWYNSDGTALYVTFGWMDEKRSPSVVLKVELPLEDYPEKKAEVVAWYFMYTPFDGMCQKNGICFVTSPMSQAIVVIDDHANQVQEVMKFPGLAPAYVTEGAKSEAIFVMAPENSGGWNGTGEGLVDSSWPVQEIRTPCGDGYGHCRVIMRVSPDGSFELRQANGEPNEGKEMYFAEYVAETDRLFVGPGLRYTKLSNPGWFREVDLGILTRLKTVSWATDFAQDTVTGEVYVAYPGGGVQVFNQDLEQVREISLPIGIRPMAYDEDRGILFVGRYDTGTTYAVDAASGRILRIWEMGEVLRTLNYIPETQEVLAVSSTGLQIINVAEAFPATATLVADASK